MASNMPVSQGLIIVIITPSHQATLPSADTITSKINSPVTQTLNTGLIRYDQRAVDIFPPSKEQRVCMKKNGQTWTLLKCDYPKHQVIGLESISLGYLNSGTCLRNSSFDGCEQYHSPEMYTRDLDYMSGRLPVKRNLAILMAFGKCNDGQTRTFGDYTVLRYDCVPDTSLTSMCRKFNRTSNILYVSNHGYPEYGSPDGKCSCVIKSTSNNVSVQFYDNRIAQGQFLKLINADGSVLKSWTKDNNFYHRQNYDFYIGSNSFHLNWDAGNVTSENGEGKFWIRIVASDKSKLSLECSERQTSKPFKIEKTDELSRSEKYARQCKEQYKESFLNPVCGGGQVIGLHHIKVGFLNGSQCKQTCDLNSCEQDHTKYQYLGTWNDTEDNGDLGKMSGRPANQHPMSTIGVSGECIPIGEHGNILFKDADYITAYYDCVNHLNSCEQDHTKYQYLGTWNDTEDNGDLGKMSGRPANQHPMSTIGVSGECIPIGEHGNILFKDADYITAYYDCVNRADITSMCTPSSRTGDVLYVWNYGYPNSGDVLERSCHCTIDSTATYFIVQTYDNRVDKRQLLDLSYGNDTIMLQWHGDENFNHIETKTVETKRSGPLTLNWRSPNGTGVMLTQKEGLFWIRIKAYDKSQISIQCFEPVWPPTTTTSTTTVSTTTDRSTKNTGNATTTPVQNRNGSEICNTDACKESQKTFCFKSTYVYGAGGGVAAILIAFIIGCIVMNTRKKVDKDSGSLVNSMDLTEMRSVNTSKEVELLRYVTSGIRKRTYSA